MVWITRVEGNPRGWRCLLLRADAIARTPLRARFRRLLCRLFQLRVCRVQLLESVSNLVKPLAQITRNEFRGSAMHSLGLLTELC